MLLLLILLNCYYVVLLLYCDNCCEKPFVSFPLLSLQVGSLIEQGPTGVRAGQPGKPSALAWPKVLAFVGGVGAFVQSIWVLFGVPWHESNMKHTSFDVIILY